MPRLSLQDKACEIGKVEAGVPAYRVAALGYLVSTLVPLSSYRSILADLQQILVEELHAITMCQMCLGCW